MKCPEISTYVGRRVTSMCATTIAKGIKATAILEITTILSQYVVDRDIGKAQVFFVLYV